MISTRCHGSGRARSTDHRFHHARRRDLPARRRRGRRRADRRTGTARPLPGTPKPGAGIYCSIVLEPDAVLTLALGLATAEAIAEPRLCDLRWPNDVMLGDKKVAGILVQLVDGQGHRRHRDQRQSHRVSAGAAKPPRCKLVTRAATFAPRTCSIALLPPIECYTAARARTTSCACSRAPPVYAAGRRVTVNQPGRRRSTAPPRGLNPDGFLIVRKDDGTDTLILAGGVRAAGS